MALFYHSEFAARQLNDPGKLATNDSPSVTARNGSALVAAISAPIGAISRSRSVARRLRR